MSRLRVALDVAHERLSGAGVTRASREMRLALELRPGVDVVPVGEGPTVERGAPGRRRLVLQHDLAWYPLGGRRAARQAEADVYHCPGLRAPLWPGSPPTVVTIHDLNFLVRPETVSRWNRHYSRATIHRVVASADRIVASTAATADDVERLLGVGGDRVRVVHLGVSERFHEPSAADLPASLARASGYVLFVGTPEPRKNLARLAEAVASLRASGREERLVVAGGDGWGGVDRGANDAVLWLGRVSDEELRALYASAGCLAIPSLHEGFGLPALEAMASGCPVVASDAGALPEVCGDAAVLVDPLSVRSIADGIAIAIDDGDAFRERGRARAREFSWTRTAERLEAVYRELA